MWSCLFLACVTGVFGVDTDEVKSVTEGDSVTLHTDLPEIQEDDQILWMFGPQETRIAEITKQINSSSVYDKVDNEIFGDRLKLNNQTGSLTITNSTSKESGLYKLQINRNTDVLYKRFDVGVYARLPVPVIIRDSSQSSSSSERSSVSKCVLLCSVMNVTHVSLSWYKGNSLLSIISVFDLNIRLSLPLEVEYQDTNTYRCVVSNPVSNQTQHINIHDYCGLCSVTTREPSFLYTAFINVMMIVSYGIFVMCAMMCSLCIKNQTGLENEEERGEKNMSEYTEVIYIF